MNKNNERKMNRQHRENRKNLIKEEVLEKSPINRSLRKRFESGITLIALVITIIVLLVLSGITIAAVGENGLFSRAKEASFKSKMSAYKEQTNLYVSWKIQENLDTDTTGINAGEVLKNAIDQEIVTDITRDDVNIDITEIIEDIKEKDKEFVVVYKGELCYVSSDSISNNAKQVKWCEEIGIKILEYTAPTGIVVKNGKYELVNGIYLCTPKLDQGFNENKTRYLEVGSNGKLTPGNWITDKPTDNWYNYKEKKWANIYVENSGSDIYYVWIPRYCFKLDQSTERSDVKFIDVDNNYKDENGNLTPWESAEGVQGLKEQGYQVPEAFWFDKNGNGIEDEGEQLAGYWAMKYTAGDITTPSTINYDMSVVQGVVNIKNITLNTTITNTNPIVKYTIALNGKIVKGITNTTAIANINSQKIEFSNLKEGDNTINVTGLNANGEIVGSMTKEYAPAIVNAPDLSGFDKDTTFYVTYDSNGQEHSTTPISQATPKFWYEYGSSQWANIVTRNNEIETYYVWIPRYEFQLDQTNERSIVKFITGTSKEKDAGYQIPEAFWFDKNGNGTEEEGEQLTGYWAMKYTAGDEAAPRFSTEVVATSSSIKTKGITGTTVGEGQKYKYYINGEYKGEKTAKTDVFEFTGLSSNTKYTILVEIRESATDKYVGTIVKQISTIDANKPELTGFNSDMTYYVLYDESGNQTIGDKIKNNGSNMPSNWYNYSNSRWANIVVTDGTIKNGKIENATKTTYYTWIPRYEFTITSSQYAQPAAGRTEVRFISGTSKETDTGYKIPEAFKFNEQELTGYWAMKYTAGE